MSREEVESSLIVPIVAAAPIEPWRERLDPFSSYGMTAHVTVLYPFLPPDRWPDDLAAELAVMFATMPSFEFDLAGIRWFEPSVVWAAPTPDDRFRAMTAAVRQRWPDLRPYGGDVAVDPHLTIGVSDDHDELEAAGRAVAELLPIRCEAREVWLMTGRKVATSWTTGHRFALGTAAAGVHDGSLD